MTYLHIYRVDPDVTAEKSLCNTDTNTYTHAACEGLHHRRRLRRDTRTAPSSSSSSQKKGKRNKMCKPLLRRLPAKIKEPLRVSPIINIIIIITVTFLFCVCAVCVRSWYFTSTLDPFHAARSPVSSALIHALISMARRCRRNLDGSAPFLTRPQASGVGQLSHASQPSVWKRSPTSATWFQLYARREKGRAERVSGQSGERRPCPALPTVIKMADVSPLPSPGDVGHLYLQTVTRLLAAILEICSNADFLKSCMTFDPSA